MIFDRFGDPAPRFVPPPRPACASTHGDPRNWAAAGFDERGYVRTICKSCKRLVGYAPPETQKQKQKQSTREIAGDE